MNQLSINGVDILYDRFSLYSDEYGVLTGRGYDKKDNREIWLAYYPESDQWEIERYFNTIDDWKNYCNCIERLIK